MMSATRLKPGDVISKLGIIVNFMKEKMKSRQAGDTNADREILELIFSADDNIKKLAYSFLLMLEQDGRLNAANIPALEAIEKMDDEMRKHAKQGIKEEDYIRRVAAHFEALTELKLKKAAKLAKHMELAKRYEEMAKEHERIAQAESK
ncbi:MAG: hypothetical protein KAS15_03060 [Nanoarchaeota archaeon]|nr:hypothetical protein [Nanoarchaeota archaeon]